MRLTLHLPSKIEIWEYKITTTHINEDESYMWIYFLQKQLKDKKLYLFKQERIHLRNMIQFLRWHIEDLKRTIHK